MIELIRVHRFDHAHVIDVFFQKRQTITDPLATLPCLVEGKTRAHHLRHALDEGELFSFEKFLRTFLAIELDQFGLVIKKLELAR